MRHYILLIFACLSTLNISAYNGRVTDVKNNPVIGATVSVMGKDSTIIAMTITDAQGLYTLDVSQFPATLPTTSRLADRIKHLRARFKELHTDQSARMSQIFDFLPPTTAITNIPGRNYEFEEADYH
jgi:hypothetical protein